MSDTKHSDELIKNEGTVNRRAWIEKAVSVVKGEVADQDDTVDVSDQPTKPNLYVVNPDRQR